MAGHIGSSSNLNWNTPHFVKDILLDTFDGMPDLDPCSNLTTIVPAKHLWMLPTNDGLVDSWSSVAKTVFWNPPFGKAYMKPDRSHIIGAKDFGRLKDQDAVWEYVTRTGRLPPGNTTDTKEVALLKALAKITRANPKFPNQLIEGGYIPQSGLYSVHTSIADWVSAAQIAWHDDHVESLGILPASIGTSHWQKGIFPFATSICWLKGRVRFLMEDGKPGGPAPMDCALVFFGAAPSQKRFQKSASRYGTVDHRRFF